jgi:hypothetical protein
MRLTDLGLKGRGSRPLTSESSVPFRKTKRGCGSGFMRRRASKVSGAALGATPVVPEQKLQCNQRRSCFTVKSQGAAKGGSLPADKDAEALRREWKQWILLRRGRGRSAAKPLVVSKQ